MIKCIYWLANYDLLFGDNSIIYSKPFINIGALNSLAFILHAQKSSTAALYFILPLMLLCIAGLLKLRVTFISDFITWFIIINIHNKVYPTLTGGDLLLNQFLFFNCFISDTFEIKNSTLNQLKICIHNFGVLAVVIQVCFVYFFAGLAKVENESWLNGSAIGLTSQVVHFSLPSIAIAATRVPALFVVLNYLVMGYQLFFSLLVWFKPIKKPLLVIGILMHLYIAFGMGLVGFGFIMIIGYIYFWPIKSGI